MKFSNLPEDKQAGIVNAAMTVFGKNGYKKTSISDIAAAAGISKSTVFYYFDSKKSMYLYLTELCANIMIAEIEKGIDRSVTGFFARIKMASDIKIATAKRYPAMMSFLVSAFAETDPDVKDELKKFMTGSENYRWDFVLDGTDITNLKDDIDPKLVMRFIVFAAEGFGNAMYSNPGVANLNEFIDDFHKFLNIMEKYFCKTE